MSKVRWSSVKRSKVSEDYELESHELKAKVKN